MNLWPLLGVVVIVLGFAARLNAVLVVVTAGIVTGLVVNMPLLKILEVMGAALINSRLILIILLTLPVIGLLERHGLREQARLWVSRLHDLSTPRLLMAYQALRQLAAMIGLTSLGGHPQTVRPLLVPMAEATAERTHGRLPEAVRQRLAALCAATDNVGLFFGEDVFFAFGAVLLMQVFLAGQGITVDTWAIALWGLPTALCAYVIHAARVSRLDRRMAAEIAAMAARAKSST